MNLKLPQSSCKAQTSSILFLQYIILWTIDRLGLELRFKAQQKAANLSLYHILTRAISSFYLPTILQQREQVGQSAVSTGSQICSNDTVLPDAGTPLYLFITYIQAAQQQEDGFEMREREKGREGGR